MRIGEREVGLGHAPYVIAEIGVNHDGDAERAMQLCDAAAGVGADAVKLQYFETDRLMSKAAKLAVYQKAAGETDPIAMLRRLELSLDDCERVIDRAHARGLHAIVTVFSLETVDAAMALPWDALKTASPDLVNAPLLQALMADGRPMIVSTGAADAEEVRGARSLLDPAADRLVFLQCVSSYPAPDAAVETVRAVASITGLPAGYSDHTNATTTGADAVRCGAVVLERHITDDRSRPGPDHAASSTLEEFRAYVEAAAAAAESNAERGAESAVAFETGDAPGVKQVLDCERDVRIVSRQSLVSTRGIPAGSVIGREDLTVKRPGTGLPAAQMDRVVGARCARDIECDVPLELEDLS